MCSGAETLNIALVAKFVPHAFVPQHVHATISNAGHNGAKVGLAHGAPLVMPPAGAIASWTISLTIVGIEFQRSLSPKWRTYAISD